MLSARLRQAVTKGSRPIISRNCASSRLTPPRLISTTPTIIQKTSLPLHLTTPISTPYRHYSGSTITPQEQEQGVEMSSGEKDIHDILAKAFTPTTLQVQDVSGGCGSFYAIVIASRDFNGKPTVKAHRLVNEALKDVITGIHGLQLRTMPVKD